MAAHSTDAPPEFSPARLITEASLLQWPAVLVLVAGFCYFGGWLVLRRRGDRWETSRSLAFSVGLVVVASTTLSGLAAYDEALVSVHMVQHMLLLMVAPVFLALGAPITLALRTLRPRPRAALLAVLHSRIARIVSFPLVGFALFTLSSYALYFTGWFEATLRNGLVHEATHLHFVAVGCLFLWPLVGADPVPGRIAYPLRALLMFATLPLHAILGLTVMGSRQVIAADFYAQNAPGIDHLADQAVAGAVLWAAGDLVALLMLGALLRQWMRASEREAQREDRRLDRLDAQRARSVEPSRSAEQ